MYSNCTCLVKIILIIFRNLQCPDKRTVFQTMEARAGLVATNVTTPQTIKVISYFTLDNIPVNDRLSVTSVTMLQHRAVILLNTCSHILMSAPTSVTGAIGVE